MTWYARITPDAKGARLGKRHRDQGCPWLRRADMSGPKPNYEVIRLNPHSTVTLTLPICEYCGGEAPLVEALELRAEDVLRRKTR